MRILFYCWKAYNQADIISALRRRGHTVDTFELELGNFEVDENFTGRFIDKLFNGEENTACSNVPEAKEHEGNECRTAEKLGSVYDAVFSVNYFPIISDICEQFSETGIKYICWTCDSPLSTMYHQSIFNKCNYIFIFDKFFYYELKQMGVRNVYYLPLAVNTERLDKLIGRQSKEDRQRFVADISFVGSMYHKNSYDDIKDKLPPYMKGYFDAAMLAQLNIYGDNIIDDLLTVDILKELSEIIDFRQGDRAFSDIRLVFESTFLGFKLANIERVSTLNRLSKTLRGHNTALYTDTIDSKLEGVDYRGAVAYMTHMPLVFNNSRINLNMTIRNIRTGIPLRVWDILGAGGFLLTNFQVELPDYFENGKDIVYYEDINDCCRKAEYYLAHEDERRLIALNGYNIVKQKHSYIQRIATILDIVNY